METADAFQMLTHIYQSTLCYIPDDCNFNHHHHHISVMKLDHLLTRSSLTYPEVSSKVCHVSFCQLGNSVSLPWAIYYEAFYLHVVSNFSYIPVICPKLMLFLIPSQFVYLFCNLSKCSNNNTSLIFAVSLIFINFLQGSSRSSSSSATTSHHMTLEELRAVNRYAESTKSLSYLPQVRSGQASQQG